MPEDALSKLAKDFYALTGAADVLTTLREELEQWVEEAQDDSKQEALENVLGHVEVMETQYKQRRDEAQQRRDEAQQRRDEAQQRLEAKG